jgi:hypothetical protein
VVAALGLERLAPLTAAALTPASAQRLLMDGAQPAVAGLDEARAPRLPTDAQQVGWFNDQRLHEALGDRPWGEVEAPYATKNVLTPSLNQ